MPSSGEGVERCFSEESSQKQPNWEEKGLENHPIRGDSLRVLFGAATLFKSAHSDSWGHSKNFLGYQPSASSSISAPGVAGCWIPLRLLSFCINRHMLLTLERSRMKTMNIKPKSTRASTFVGVRSNLFAIWYLSNCNI